MLKHSLLFGSSRGNKEVWCCGRTPGRGKGDIGLLQFPVTDDLETIEKAGSAWASRCTKDLLTVKDFEFFATRYKPFYECLKEVEGLFQATLDEFDPFAQHEDCRVLFAPAFGTYGALMLSPPMNPVGRVPDLKFAAFEAGAIRTVRQTWETMKQK
jgi:hypothetical protein